MPPQYCLRPRKLVLPEDASAKQIGEADERESREWAEADSRLREIISGAIEALGWPEDDPRRMKYECSATHQEILRGALDLPDEREHVFAFFRRIDNLADLAASCRIADLLATSSTATSTTGLTSHLIYDWSHSKSD